LEVVVFEDEGVTGKDADEGLGEDSEESAVGNCVASISSSPPNRRVIEYGFVSLQLKSP
jgi:hypothetical protein